LAISALEIARADAWVTTVDDPVPSTLSQPCTETIPDGELGTFGRSFPKFWVCSQPRSTSTAAPVEVTSGVTTSTPGSPLCVWYRMTTVCASS